MEHLTEILILVMLTIVFFQSGLDKILDWKGNLDWFTDHFKNTFLRKQASFALAWITLMELCSGALSVVGITCLLYEGNHTFALYGALLSALTFLFLFFGQRIAKDYGGAQTIVVYLIPTFFLLWILQP